MLAVHLTDPSGLSHVNLTGVMCTKVVSERTSLKRTTGYASGFREMATRSAAVASGSRVSSGRVRSIQHRRKG